jgi:hypothetical protein
MGTQQSGDGSGSGISRRAYLGAVGLAAASPALMGTTSANAGNFDTVVNMVEAGADNTGRELIDDVFDDVKGDNTLLEFPPGTYVANELIFYALSNFAMVGDDATLVPGPDYREDVWLGGGDVEDVRIENFTIDNTKDGQGPEVDISAFGGLEFRNITKAGHHDGTGTAFAFQMIRNDGQGIIENVRAPDGGTAVGMYLQGDGPVTVRDCHIEGFTNNGLYASHISAPVTVEGGHFKDNNIAQVRLGSDGSSLSDATLEVTEPVVGPDTDVVNMRGVRIADGPGPVRVENCEISMRGASGNGGIVTAYSGGSLEVVNTRIYVDREYTTISSDGSRTSWGVFIDNPGDGYPSGSRSFQNVSITGGGRYMSGMLIRRGDNTFSGLCLNQTGEGRDGIIFEDSSNNTLADSTLDVPDETIVLRDSSVQKSNLAYEGSCPAPNLGETDSERDGISTSDNSIEVEGEMGRVVHEQAVADEWTSVGFSRSYDRPVVISQPLSYEGWHPCHVRVANVGSTGYSYKFEEWQYLDGDHRAEAASYVAVDAATTTRGIAAGTVSANHQFTTFDWPGEFEQLPVVLAQPQTFNGSDPIVPRLRNVTTDGAEIRVQEEEGEANGGYHYAETVGYVAIQRGTGTLGGKAFEAEFTDVGVDEHWYHIDFDRSYDTPRFVAAIQSYNGPNTVNLRYKNLTSTGVDVFLEEEQSADSETGHVAERVGYLVIEDN